MNCLFVGYNGKREIEFSKNDYDFISNPDDFIITFKFYLNDTDFLKLQDLDDIYCVQLTRTRCIYTFIHPVCLFNTTNNEIHISDTVFEIKLKGLP